MQLVYRITAFALVLGLLFSPDLAKANTPFSPLKKSEYTKTIKKDFGIDSRGTVDITNKYGRVKFLTWDQNRAKISVIIIVNATSESAAQQVFDRISIDFSNTDALVKAVTNIESRSGSWWGSWNSNSKADYTINYEVFLPATNNIRVNNKYGDVYADRIQGSADVSVKYGNFKLEGVGDDTKIYLGYGNGSLLEGRDINAIVSYSKLQMKNIKDIDVESKYSTLTIGQCGDLRCNSKYDTYRVEEVRELRNIGKYDNLEIDAADEIIITSRYSNLNVGDIRRSCDLNMEYGGAMIKGLSPGFEMVNLQGDYTDFKVSLKDGTPFKLDAYAENAGIRYPSAMSVSYEKDRGSSHEVKATLGTPRQGASAITARLRYGGLKVRLAD